MVNILTHKNEEFQQKLKSAYKPLRDKLTQKHNTQKVISKTENNIKNIVFDMNEKILEKIKLFSNKLEENIKQQNNIGNNNNLKYKISLFEDINKNIISTLEKNNEEINTNKDMENIQTSLNLLNSSVPKAPVNL